MKTKILIGLLMVAIVLLSGCAEKECETAAECLEKTCSTVDCEDNSCVYSPVPDCCGNELCEVGESYPECAADCPNCGDSNECTTDSYDYHKHECVNTIIPNQICCGNDKCETGETYSTCAQDCPNCDDDNDCTKDSYDYHEQKCVNERIMECCGNAICEEGIETSAGCAADCPDCDDSDKLTTDSFNYASQKCENIIIPHFTGDFEEGTNSPSGWSPDWPDYMVWDTEQVHSGLRSLKTTLSNVPLDWYIWRSDNIPVKANQNYHLRGWIKTENADQGAQIDVHFFDASYMDLGNGGGAGELSGTNAWTFKESIFVTPPSTKYIQVLSGFHGTNGIAWFDDITLIEETD